MKLFGLQASSDGARRLADELGLGLAAHEERDFEDGEFKIRPLESVRRERVVVYQSLAGGQGSSANDKLMRLLVFTGALKDAGAAEVTVVAPYLAYMRKDRRTKSRDPVSTRYIAQMFEAVGVDEVITIDVHNPAAFENAFRCRTRNIEAAPLFVEHFKTEALLAGRVVVVSPDAGGIKRAHHFAELLAGAGARSVDVAFAEKHRSEGRVTGEMLAGDVEGAIVIIIDDMISGGTTMRRAAGLCLERGARTVHVAATHGVFAREAAAVLGDPSIVSVVVTDTIAGIEERARGFAARPTVLTTQKLLAPLLRDVGE